MADEKGVSTSCPSPWSSHSHTIGAGHQKKVRELYKRLERVFFKTY